MAQNSSMCSAAQVGGHGGLARWWYWVWALKSNQTSPNGTMVITVDIRKGRPDWNIFRDGCPGGETPGQVSDRADRLIANLRKLDGKVALFSHGQFGCVLAARWIGLPVMEGPHFVLGTASLSIFGYDPDHPTVPVISLWNAFSGEMLELLPHTPRGDIRTMKERAIQRWETDGGEIPHEVAHETKVGRRIGR